MRYFSILLILFLSGCAITQKFTEPEKPKLAENRMQREFDNILPPAGPRITVAVYSFQDKTGQKRNIPNTTSFSSAVTQDGAPFLIEALENVSHGRWFDVVERENVDDLIRERTIITQMRGAYEGKDAQKLMPLKFAGIILEGGIIGYDSGMESGGAAYRWLGIGPTTLYSKDIITISLRAISVNTGKILCSITVTKTVYSTADSVAVLKFFDNGTQSFETETGLTINEPGTLAVKEAIDASVVDLIKEGARKGVWDFSGAMLPGAKK